MESSVYSGRDMVGHKISVKRTVRGHMRGASQMAVEVNHCPTSAVWVVTVGRESGDVGLASYERRGARSRQGVVG